MSDNKQPESVNSPAQAGEAAEPKSNFARAARANGDKRKSGAKKGGTGWLWLLLLLLIAGAAAWGWFNWPQLRQEVMQRLDAIPMLNGDARENTDGATVSPQTQTQPAEVQPAQQPQPEPQKVPPQTHAPDQSAALRAQLEQQQQTIQQLQQQLASLQRNVTAQGNRLGELGNASREDWQLAEADYLLRLANQRLLLERDSRAALALVEQVDSILRNVDMPDLYGVRQQVAQDLTALKLVENIDREGLYLRLRALEDQMLRVDIQPEFDLATRAPAEQEQPATQGESTSWRDSWNNFTGFLRNSVRVRDGSIDPVLLSPQSEARFRQSLRLNMEQAELALLRGNETVYRDSLTTAQQLLNEYATDSHQRRVILNELQALAALPVQVELPSLAGSQTALRNYIERLHKVGEPAQRAPAQQLPTQQPPVQQPPVQQPPAQQSPLQPSPTQQPQVRFPQTDGSGTLPQNDAGDSQQ